MTNILAPANIQVLEELCSSNVLLAFDYDGTLAPIVANPDRAAMRLPTRLLLTTLAQRYRVAVISGRAQSDVLHRLTGTGVSEVVGNHGIEPWDASHRHVSVVRQWLPLVEGQLSQLEGVTVEDKVFSIAIHYRRSQEKRTAQAAILKAAVGLNDARVVGGRFVVNVIPMGAPHKGIALDRERRRRYCDTAIYVGDDETDEDVFRLDHPGRLLTIRVGWKTTSAARYHLKDQRAVDDLLTSLIAFRRSADA